MTAPAIRLAVAADHPHLLAHARRLKGALSVDVNEQNPQALAFYLQCGFVQVGRSPLDPAGRPFPILHLREA